MTRVDLSDPLRPRLMQRWFPPTQAGAPALPSVVTGIREHRGRAVLLTAWNDSTADRFGYPGGELMVLDTAEDGTVVLRARHAIPCCARELLGEGDDLVTRQRFPKERAVWWQIGPNDEFSSPRGLPLLTHAYANPTWAAAVFDGGFWRLDALRAVRLVRLDAELEIGPILGLNARPIPALLLPAGDRLLYALPDAHGWLATPEDPLVEAPRHGALPRLPSRMVEAIVPVDDGVIAVSDGVPLLFASSEPGADLEEMKGAGEPVDYLRDLMVDGEKLYARRQGSLYHWRIEGPRTVSALGRIEVVGGSPSVDRFHAADDGWLVYSNAHSNRSLVVLRARPSRGARRFAVVDAAQAWYGHTRIRDGLLWLRGGAPGPGLGLSGLHIDDDSVTRLTASFRFPSGGRLPQDVVWEGDLLVTSLDNDVWIFDMADPRDPRLLGSIEMPGEVVAATLSGTTAWVAWESRYSTTLRLYDLSVPDAPRPLGPDIPLVGERVHVDIRFQDGHAWLRVDDVLQRRRVLAAPARATAPPWVVPPPNEIYLPALLDEPTESAP